MAVHTADSLIEDLRTLDVDPKGTLMVHISYKSLGTIEGRGEAVIEALEKYMADGLLVVPAHTWKQVDKLNPVMDVELTPCCIGIIPELFRKRKTSVRSLHPTHSVCATGKDALDFISGEEKTASPCPRSGVYGKLIDREATILLIGVEFNRNTFIHCITEIVDTPGHLEDKITDLYVYDKDQKRIHVPQRRHCHALGSETFCKVQDKMKEQGAMKLGKFGDATVMRCDAKILTEKLSILLTENPLIFDDMAPLAQ